MTRESTHVDEPGRAQEQMVLLELLGVNDTEVTTYAAIRVSKVIGTFEFLILRVGKVGHRALELGDDGARHERARGENA